MRVQLPHRFSGADEAAAKIKQALDEARPKLAAEATVHEERWEGDALHFDVTVQGTRVLGTLTAREHDFDLYAKLPLMLRMFEGRIERAIAEQAKQLLGQ